VNLIDERPCHDVTCNAARMPPTYHRLEDPRRAGSVHVSTSLTGSGAHFGGSSKGLHSARRGDYRVVYRIDDARHVVVIETLAHRSDIQRRR